MLDSGVSVDVTNEYGTTALLYAAKTDQQEAAALLLARGARVNATNGAKTTALHCAASGGHLAMCRLLIENGAYLRAKDEDRDTPLDVADEEGQLECCAYLKKASVAMAETELREAAAGSDARALTMAIERAEDEELVSEKLIASARDRLAILHGVPAVGASLQRTSDELEEAKRALAAMEAAAEHATRRMLMAAAIGAVLAAGLVAALGGMRRRR